MASRLVLTENEVIIATLRGEFFSNTTSVLLNMLRKILQFVLFIIGVRSVGQLVVTNKRVVIEESILVFWCLPNKASFKSISYRGVSSVEYAFEAIFLYCLCRKYLLTITQNSGESFGFVIKGGEAEASSIANAIIQQM